MIAATFYCVLLGVSFEEVRIPGLEVGAADSIRGIPEVNFRHADLDGDGDMDLVLPAASYLSVEGKLTLDNPIPPPPVAATSRSDLWGSNLYVVDLSSVQVFALVDHAWKQMFSAEIPSAGSSADPIGALTKGSARDSGEGLSFERFLHDTDGDGEPEIFRTESGGLRVLVRRGAGYVESRLSIYPQLSVSPPPDVQLWPEGRRRFVLPVRSMACRIVIADRQTLVVRRIHAQPEMVRYQIDSYSLQPNEDGSFSQQSEGSYASTLMPECMEVCDLDGDGVLDFAGGAFDETAAIGAPLYRSYVSIRGTEGVMMAVTRGFRPYAIVTDLNGDGLLDWLGERSGMFEGGYREIARRVVTQRRFSHEVLARMQVNGSFDSEWKRLGRFSIELDQAPIHNSERFRKYQSGTLVNCTADFDGDGWNDALVHDRPGHASVFLGGVDGFARHSAATLEFPVGSHIFAVDVDGDDRDDVVVRRPPGIDQQPQGGTIVFLSRTGSAR